MHIHLEVNLKKIKFMCVEVFEVAGSSPHSLVLSLSLDRVPHDTGVSQSGPPWVALQSL